MVEEASEYKPELNPMRVFVAFAAVPNAVVGVYGKAPTPLCAKKLFAEVVEKKYPLSVALRNAVADVVLNAAPWLTVRKCEAEVVEKKSFAAFHASAEVVEKK
jgi:hypothetical protein